jgi:hypothetical protein
MDFGENYMPHWDGWTRGVTESGKKTVSNILV